MTQLGLYYFPTRSLPLDYHPFLGLAHPSLLGHLVHEVHPRPQQESQVCYYAHWLKDSHC